MTRQEKILRTGFALFSVCTSFLLVFYAVGTTFGNPATPQAESFAYLAGGYGLINIYILSWSWRTQASWSSKANLLLAACVFSAVSVELFREGIQSQKQLLTILGLIVVLGINWQTTRVLCRKPDLPRPSKRSAGKRR